MHNEVFSQTTTLGTVNYCTNYTTVGQVCRLGDTSDFRCLTEPFTSVYITCVCRCGLNSVCIPVVGQDVVLPRANMDFSVSDIIGECNPYCIQCSDTIALVCGGDGQTYQNSCFAQCAGVEVRSRLVDVSKYVCSSFRC